MKGNTMKLCSISSRRDFCKTAVKGTVVLQAVTAGVFGNDIVNHSQFRKELELDTTKDEYKALKDVGGYVFVEVTEINSKIIVNRTADDKATSYLLKCTHQGGPLTKPDSSGIMVCDWHAAEFNTAGEVKKGPAMDNLREYKARIEGDKIIVNLDDVNIDTAIAAQTLKSTIQYSKKEKSFVVTLPKERAVVNIYTAAGKRVYSRVFTGRPTAQIKGTFSKGHYLAEIIAPSGRSAHKITVLP